MHNLILYNHASKVHGHDNAKDFFCTKNFTSSLKYQGDSFDITLQIDDFKQNKIFNVGIEETEFVKPKFNYLQQEKLYYIIDTSKVVLINDNNTSRYNFIQPALAFEFSPSEDYLAVCYEDGLVSTFGAPFWIGEWNCSTSSVSQDMTHATIGWGSSDTQFTGKRKQKIDEVSRIQYQNTDKSSAIAWRGNGSMFVVNFFDSTVNTRRIKIYSSDCILLGEFKDVPNLESCIAFRPEGQSIGVIINERSTQELVILARNGTIRKRIPLDSSSHCYEIKWDQNNCCLGISRENNGHSVVDLFLHHDYSWIPKYRIPIKIDTFKKFEFLDAPVGTVKLRIYCVDNIYEYTFLIKPIRSVNEIDNCSVTVDIIGKSTELFIYHKDSIPGEPKTLIFDNQINEVIFDRKSNKIALLDSENKVAIYKYENIEELFLIDKFVLPDFPEQIHNYIFYFDTNHDLKHFKSEKNLEYNFDYYKTFDDPFESNELFQLTSDKIILQGIRVDTVNSLLLDVDGDLYWNGTLIQKNVSSIFVYEDFLLYTQTISYNARSSFHTLLYFKLSLLFANRKMPKSPCYRSIEQFAKIINIIPKTGTLVLSMPRGNIEHVELRILKLFLIKRMIEEKKFSLAFQELFTSSLPLNFLYQLSEKTFFDHTEEFIQQLQDEKLKIIIKTTEPVFTLSDFEAQSILELGVFRDINLIMKHLRNTILSCNEYQRFLPTLGLIKMLNFKGETVTYELIEALREIANICQGDYRTYKTEIEAALRELAQLTSEIEIYRFSFLVDLELAQFILSNTQLDPQFEQQEFDTYKNMTESIRRATICASRNEKQNAVKYYVNSYKNGEMDNKALIDACLRINALNYLYSQIDKTLDGLFDIVSQLYATELENKQDYLNAGIVYFRNKNWRYAYNCFVHGKHVDKALLAIGRMDADVRSTTLSDLIKSLIEQALFEEVGNIYSSVLSNNDEAIKYYLLAEKFKSALMIANNKQFKEIKMQMKIYFTDIKEKIDELKDFHSINFQRLKEIREERLKSLAPDCELIDDIPAEDSSLYQDSIMSGHTGASTSRSSTRSSRNTENTMSRNERKLAKKYLNDKRGAKYEDIALMYNLYRNTCKVYRLYAELHENVQHFKMISFDNIYLTPLNRLQELQTQVRDDAKFIWPDDEYIINGMNSRTFGPEQLICKNFTKLDPIYRQEPLATFGRDGVLKSLACDK